MLARSEWPQATKAYLAGRRTVTAPEVATAALCYPAAPLNSEVALWIADALTGLGWRRERPSSGVWRRKR
jgi:hypothetical protein